MFPVLITELEQIYLELLCRIILLRPGMDPKLPEADQQAQDGAKRTLTAIIWHYAAVSSADHSNRTDAFGIVLQNHIVAPWHGSKAS